MKKTPLIYVDHGSPMRILEDNLINDKLSILGKDLEKIDIKAILIVSAHWITNGIYITTSLNLETIHDFYGFSDELYDLNYPAKTSDFLIDQIKKLLPFVKEDSNYGLDHGAWTVLKKIFPKANIPVVQMSIDGNLDAKNYFEIGEKLSLLREKGVLIIGSGSIVHNLRDFSWDENIVFPWAKDFDEKIKKFILEKDFNSIINYEKIDDYKKSVPSFDHFVPLLYILGATFKDEKLTYFYENISNGSLTNNIIISK
ncbi:MAG: class III extradiol ring-cleavage dioxygenase [Candidatus Gracilibacteria bacterium]|nr:class III extradiol ring-cleavage dioxygenase [Candidatus Gracilibacteria bacterium]